MSNRKNPAWKYGVEVEIEEQKGCKYIESKFYDKVLKRGVYRIKEHLAGVFRVFGFDEARLGGGGARLVGDQFESVMGLSGRLGGGFHRRIRAMVVMVKEESDGGYGCWVNEESGGGGGVGEGCSSSTKNSRRGTATRSQEGLLGESSETASGFSVVAEVAQATRGRNYQ
ncbi:hypothetical protein LWI28_005060 [Acer negundo]|uniref:Uncharacterized protein n=1 Tax=Acer negundo TaxID=4023 RepID=A0AAD5NWE6_ACENE|nr:hypothetical protein LWI28_005060 [Acer negundo]